MSYRFIFVFCFIRCLEIGGYIIDFPRPTVERDTDALVQTGYVSQFAPGVMQEVVGNRISFGQITQSQLDQYGMNTVAVYSCSWVGSTVLLVWSNGDREVHLVADCVNPIHWHDVNAIDFWEQVVVEVSAETAERRGFRNRGGVLVTMHRLTSQSR